MTNSLTTARFICLRVLATLTLFAATASVTDAAAQSAKTSVYFYTVQVRDASSLRHTETDGPHTHTAAESRAHQAQLRTAAVQKYGQGVTILARSTGSGGCILIYRNPDGLTARMFEPNQKDLEDKLRKRQTTLRIEVVAGPACG